VRVRAFLIAAPTILALALPGSALAQGGGSINQSGPSNPLAPGLPQPSVSTPTTTTPTIITATSGSSSSSGLSGGDAIAIAIGAIVLLGGISFFIWHDARRRAPIRHRAATAAAGAGSGSKPRPKPRKLSRAERRRRKRGRAR